MFVVVTLALKLSPYFTCGLFCSGKLLGRCGGLMATRVGSTVKSWVQLLLPQNFFQANLSSLTLFSVGVHTKG